MTIRLLTTKQAASYLSVSPSFLEKDRWRGARIPFVKIASRSIRYKQQDLDSYVESQTMLSTSEYVA
jgi:excisionase family DNA binding protein